MVSIVWNSGAGRAFLEPRSWRAEHRTAALSPLAACKSPLLQVKRAGRQPPIPATAIAVPAQQGIQSPRRFLAVIPQWMWAIGTIIALLTFIRMYA